MEHMSWNMKLLFIFLMIISSLAGVSTKYIFMMWLFMEVTTLSFIFLICSDSTKFTNLSGVKFFLIQAISSIFLLFSFLMINYMFFLVNWFWVMELILIFKIGVPPFHFWVISMIPGLSWMNFFFFSSVLKIIPLNMLSYNYSSLMSGVLILSSLISTYGGIFQYKLKLVLAYSSMFMYNWIFLLILINHINWIKFFILYCVTLMMLIFFLVKIMKNSWEINFNLIPMSMKIYLFMILLMIGGFPPSPIFFLKVSILFNLLEVNMLYLSVLIILLSGGNMYMYMKFMKNFLMMYNYQSFIFEVKKKDIILFFFLVFIQFFLILCSSFKI